MHDNFIGDDIIRDKPLIPRFWAFSAVKVPTMNEKHVVFQSNDKHTADVGYKEVQEDYEMNVIGYADAVIDPRTMMIKSLDASVADRAML